MATVIIDEGLFSQGEPWYEDGQLAGWEPEVEFLVVPGDTPAAADALRVAASRFMDVDEHGQTVTMEDRRAPRDPFTPNYTAVYRNSMGLQTYIDLKGAVTRKQAEAMLAILVEELADRGVDARIMAPPEGIDDGELIG